MCGITRDMQLANAAVLTVSKRLFFQCFCQNHWNLQAACSTLQISAVNLLMLLLSTFKKEIREQVGNGRQKREVRAPLLRRDCNFISCKTFFKQLRRKSTPSLRDIPTCRSKLHSPSIYMIYTRILSTRLFNQHLRTCNNYPKN